MGGVAFLPQMSIFGELFSQNELPETHLAPFEKLSMNNFSGTVPVRQRMKAVSFQMISLQRDKEASSGWELPVFHPLFAREQTITAVSWSAWQLTICQRVVAALRETIIVVNLLGRKKWCKYWQYFFISCKVAKFESFQQSRKLSAPCSTPSCFPSKS